MMSPGTCNNPSGALGDNHAVDSLQNTETQGVEKGGPKAALNKKSEEICKSSKPVSARNEALSSAHKASVYNNI
jgi:hypothetical protein